MSITSLKTGDKVWVLNESTLSIQEVRVLSVSTFARNFSDGEKIYHTDVDVEGDLDSFRLGAVNGVVRGYHSYEYASQSEILFLSWEDVVGEVEYLIQKKEEEVKRLKKAIGK